jgi:hypothetical protein
MHHQKHGTVVSDQSWMFGLQTMEHDHVGSSSLSSGLFFPFVCNRWSLFAWSGLPLTQEELVTKIESAGYLQVRDVKSAAEGISAKAMKNGKEVALVIDSTGQVKEKSQDH